MNKRYIDFVPTNNRKVSRNGRKSEIHVQMPSAELQVRRGVVREVTERRVTKSDVRKTTEVSPQVRKVPSKNVATKAYYRGASVGDGGVNVSKKTPSLGVVEDLGNKFVKTDVPKRPLGEGVKASISKQSIKKNDLEVAKSRRLVGRKVKKPSENNLPFGLKVTNDNHQYKTPQTTFINQEKIVKRPLSGHSKNAYPKKTVVHKEAPSGPVAIISKPEKESHVGMVVAVIITIILRAAAGTVAFLLLPK